MKKNNFNYYDFCKKLKRLKWFNWVDDHIIYYIFNKPYDSYKKLKYWFKCNWNKQHWKTVKSAILGYPWDGESLWEIEECKIDEFIHYFEKKHVQNILSDDRYNKIMSTLKIAKYLVHIIATNGDDLYECSGAFEFKPISENSDMYEVKKSTFKCIYKGPYINVRTANKYVGNNKNSIEWYTRESNLHELYVLKAKHLYCKMREMYTDIWWF